MLQVILGTVKFVAVLALALVGGASILGVFALHNGLIGIDSVEALASRAGTLQEFTLSSLGLTAGGGLVGLGGIAYRWLPWIERVNRIMSQLDGPPSSAGRP